MQSTSSVAQGSFLFLPDNFSLSKLKKSRKRKLCQEFEDKWETAFNKIWDAVHLEIKEINERLFSRVLEDLVNHLKKLHNDVKLSEGVIPCEILLTGANLPDHKLLLSSLVEKVNQQITPFLVSLWSWNCGNIKNVIQNLVTQIIPLGKLKKKYDVDSDEISDYDVETEDDEDDDDHDDHDDHDDDDSNNANINKNNAIKDDSNENSNKDSFQRLGIHFQTSQYNLSTLSSWYEIQCKDKNKKLPIIIVIPDFESFLPNVLGEFILLLSAYSSRIPFVLIFGVATTPVVVYQNLPRKILSQLVIQLFRSEPSTSLLNNIIENVLFSERCPFRLGAKCMTFLTDIFLFHCFSVHSFIQGFKYCLMEHFYKRNHFTLCCSSDCVDEQANLLNEDELDNIRKLTSFQKFVEKSSKEDRKALLLDTKHTKVTVARMVKDILDYTKNFHTALKCLHLLCNNLPNSPLGRNIREFYCKAISCNINESAEFKECMKFLGLQSQNELIFKINNVIDLLKADSIADILCENEPEKLEGIINKFEEFKAEFDEMGNIKVEDADTSENEFEILRKKFLNYIESEVVVNMLYDHTVLPLHEIIYFDDLPAIRRKISGSPRGAIHLALNDPQCYLNCKCCKLSCPEAIMATLPDLSIAYKLHLECNKMINMYDWLQSFAASLKTDSSEPEEEISKEIQARFTRAVSELQFLGFIKPSRTKVDHVTRLILGNS